MAHIGQSPAYIIDAVTPVSQEQSCNRLRSAAVTAEQLFTCKLVGRKPTHSGKSPTHSRHFAQMG